MQYPITIDLKAKILASYNSKSKAIEHFIPYTKLPFFYRKNKLQDSDSTLISENML